jgi:ERCC4-type nuclease
MKIILDERETALYAACHPISTQKQIPLEKRVLDLGDIWVSSLEEKIQVMVERKSLSDLVSSIKDGRYEEQSHRLQHASGIPRHNIIYISNSNYFSIECFYGLQVFFYLIFHILDFYFSLHSVKRSPLKKI